MPLTAGTKLGTYEIVVPLGSGGMGEVYRVKDLELGREVAIKVLRKEIASEPDALKRPASVSYRWPWLRRSASSSGRRLCRARVRAARSSGRASYEDSTESLAGHVWQSCSDALYR